MADESLGLIKNLAGGQTFALGSFYDDGDIVATPTIVAGDVTISLDYGNFANITTLPTAVGTSTKEYKQFITQAESNCDVAIIHYEDQTSPATWDPFTMVLTMATNRNSGLSTSAEIAALNDPSAATIADAVWDETMADHTTAGTTGEKLNDTCCPLGSGAVTSTYTITDSGTGFPIQGVTVTVTTDLAGTNIIAAGTTDASGEIDFYLDPGTYYMWSYKLGYSFTNPDTEVVV